MNYIHIVIYIEVDSIPDFNFSIKMTKKWR